MNKFLVIFLLIFSVSLGFSQNSIDGQILLESTDIPVIGAIVTIKGTKQYAVTNRDGFFSIATSDNNEITLEVKSIGYKNEEFSSSDLSNSNKIVYLQEDGFDVETILVSGFANVGGYLGSLSSPPSTNYISTETLREINSTDINKVLFQIPGVNFQEEDGFGLRPNVGIRGSGTERSSKITIMEDEVLVAPAPYAAPSAYYFPSIGRISAIEIRKGSSQIEYGPYTTGGVINLVSTPIPDQFKGQIRGNLGDFTTGDFYGAVGSKLGNGFGFNLETNQYGSDGFKDLPNGSSTGFYKQDYLGKLSWENSTNAPIRHQFLLKVGTTLEDSNETYLGLTASDFSDNAFARYAGSQLDNINTDHQQLSLNYTISPHKDLAIKTTLYNNTFARNWYRLDKINDLEGNQVGIVSLLSDPESFSEQFGFVTGEVDSGNSSVLNLKANNREYINRGIQTKVNWSIADNQNLVTGIRVHKDNMDRFQWIDGYSINDGLLNLENAGIPGTESNRIETANAVAAYANYDLSIKNLVIRPGLRYENISIRRDNFGNNDPERIGTVLAVRENEIDAWIPGVSFQYSIHDEHQIFAGVHKGFAPPGSTPDTDPESSINYELGYRFNHKNSFLNTSLFYNDYENLLGADNASSGGLGSGDLFNAGEARTFGLEFSGQHYFVLNKNSHIPFNLSYTYTNAEFQSDFSSEFDGWGDVQAGDKLPYLSPNQFNSTIGYQSKTFGANIRSNFVDDMRTLPGQGEVTDQSLIESRLLLNLDGNMLLSKDIKLMARINNILNETYIVSQRPSGLRPGMPRAVSLGFSMDF